MIETRILKSRSIKEIKRALRKIEEFRFNEHCFEEYFALCKYAYNGVVMPIFSFRPMESSFLNQDYGIKRARKYNGVISNDTSYFWEPPKHLVKSPGRCNLAGESMFYGANHVSTALIESRANIDELWFVSSFDI